MDIDRFFSELMKGGTEWNDIIISIVPDNKRRSALISEIAISWLERKEDINERLKDLVAFKYYFIRTILNQVKSNTSPLYKNAIRTHGDKTDFSIIDIEDDSTIEEKIEFEEQLEWIEETLLKLKIGWFSAEMFRLYYKEGWTYREIEAEYGINHLTAWVEVKKVKDKLMKAKNGDNRWD
jgi:RNA polymerase sigma factor (sigma-70 family)